MFNFFFHGGFMKKTYLIPIAVAILVAASAFWFGAATNNVLDASKNFTEAVQAELAPLGMPFSTEVVNDLPFAVSDIVRPFMRNDDAANLLSVATLKQLVPFMFVVNNLGDQMINGGTDPYMRALISRVIVFLL